MAGQANYPYTKSWFEITQWVFPILKLRW